MKDKRYRNYSGDFTISPNYSYIESVIAMYKKTFPCCYTIDVGILGDAETVVIEFNDMWAIGNYGMSNSEYMTMLSKRYHEILLKSKDKWL